jgi:SAM-dependent methyltransferase
MDQEIAQYLQANRARWDDLVPIHARSAFYDVEGFRGGRITLMDLEQEEIGDVRGKSLLHLQCHFGLDTLSWARLGAQATGVDFSPRAIDLGRSLNDELDLDVEFVCADVYDLPDVLSRQFDIVFTSYGVLTWLPDLRRWAEVVAHFVRPGGTFYIAEIHPFALVFDDREDATALQIHEPYPYFPVPEPLVFEEDGTYADQDAAIEHRTTYEWPYTVGDVVTFLIDAGLRIEFLHEFPFACYRMFPFLEQDKAGRWWLPGRNETVPMTFSLKATKEIK